MKKVFRPEQARLEEYSAKRRAEVAEHPDGACPTAEICKDRCEILERALDCYKTGKAALRGVDVHYEGGWHAEKVAGSTDDYKVAHEGGLPPEYGDCLRGKWGGYLAGIMISQSAGIVGVGLLSHGAAYRRKLRRFRERTDARLVPSLSPTYAGLSLAGRF